jgi:glyoxylase-like metal-dependent hydrolase (beta-lactamase superfamily II)
VRDCFFLTCGRLGPAPGRLTNTVAVAVREDGDVVLVDTGWSAETCADPVRAIGRLRMLSLGVRVRASDAVVAQLRALGIEPSRVKTIVATHLHLDHVGGLADFPDAEVVLSESELRAFRSTTGRLGYRARDLAKTGRIRTVETADGPAYGFPASADVFGDGEVLVLDARGHTAGSVAVALRAPRGAFVHAGDAVYERWEYGLGPRSGPSWVARFTSWNRRALEQTYASLRACEADARRPTVVPSHDATAYEAVPHAPTAAASA